MDTGTPSAPVAGQPMVQPSEPSEPPRPLDSEPDAGTTDTMIPGCVPSSDDFSEACDGKDNDCDGKVDEGFANCRPGATCTENEQRPCENECGTGVYICQNGDWSPCAVTQPNEETCNNRDDDCDGKTDETVCMGPTGGSGGSVFPIGGMGTTAGQSAPPTGGIQQMGGQPQNGGAPIGGQDDPGGMPVDPGPPRCQSHAACDANEFCFSGQCFDGLPGDYAFTLISARYEDVGDFGSDPDVYAELSVDGRTTDERRTPKLSDPRFVRWNHVIRPVRLRPRQDIEICVYDADPFNDDEIGCIRFTSENVVQVIRSFDPALQPAGRPLWASVRPEPPNESNLTEFSMTIERLITR